MELFEKFGSPPWTHLELLSVTYWRGCCRGSLPGLASWEPGHEGRDYARVSTADGRQEVENQLAELRRFATNQDWEIAGEYVDHQSSSRADRVEFRRMFRDAGQRRFDLILVWALDRLTREGVAETFEYISDSLHTESSLSVSPRSTSARRGQRES